jgi:hypothetical protein
MTLRKVGVVQFHPNQRALFRTGGLAEQWVQQLWVPRILAPDFQKFWHSRVVGEVYAMRRLRSRVI